MKGRSGETRVRPGCTWKDLDETLWNRYFWQLLKLWKTVDSGKKGYSQFRFITWFEHTKVFQNQ